MDRVVPLLGNLLLATARPPGGRVSRWGSRKVLMITVDG